MQFHGRSEVGQNFGGSVVRDGLFYGLQRCITCFYGFQIDGYAVYLQIIRSY